MAIWYLSRATGAATLVLLTASLALGVANAERVASRRFPRFVVDGLHRTLSLATCVLLALHVTTTLLDGYAPIRLVDALVPFTGSYRPVWLGLGALALDLLVALAVTSLLRARLGLRAWRVVHWSAYACWPVALVHGLGTGSDVRAGWLTWWRWRVAWSSALWCSRVSPTAGRRARCASAGSPSCSRVPSAMTVWLPSGPLAPGWAAKAGTPRRCCAAPTRRGRGDERARPQGRPRGTADLARAPPRPSTAPLPATGPELIAEVERAGLVAAAAPVPGGDQARGRAAAGSNPVVVVNGTEGEPMSAKDRVLLTHAPHLVLDGAQAAARAVGAREILLAAPAETHPMLPAHSRAL